MTEEREQEILKWLVNCVDDGYLDIRDTVGEEEEFTVLKKIIYKSVALESLNIRFNLYDKIGDCPCCNATVWNSVDSDVCKVCGQKLRWRE